MVTKINDYDHPLRSHNIIHKKEKGLGLHLAEEWIKDNVTSSDAKKLHVNYWLVLIGWGPRPWIFIAISHTSRKEHFYACNISFLKRQISWPYCQVRSLKQQIILKRAVIEASLQPEVKNRTRRCRKPPSAGLRSGSVRPSPSSRAGVTTPLCQSDARVHWSLKLRPRRQGIFSLNKWASTGCMMYI